jgi:hypothetical protein
VEDDSGEFAPRLEECAVHDGGIEEMTKVGDKGVRAFLKYYVTDAIGAWGFITTEIADGPLNLVGSDTGHACDRVRIYHILGDRISNRGRRKEGRS